MLYYGVTTESFPVFTNKLATIEAGTKVCLECVDPLTGGWKVGTADKVWNMSGDKVRRQIKIES